MAVFLEPYHSEPHKAHSSGPLTPDGLSIEFAVRTNRTMGGMFLLQARKPTTSTGISRHGATATLQAVKELYEAGFLMIKVF